MQLPLNSAAITCIYGVDRTVNGIKKRHTGVDLISTTGDREVKAIGDGVIRGNFNDPTGYGNYVSIEHADGKRVLYCHLESFIKKPGDMVRAGDIIGIEGSTGNSTGVHLHLEVREAPYVAHNNIDVTKYLGIKNEKGVVQKRNLNYLEKIALVKEKVGYDDNTCNYLFNYYKYGTEALDKLVKALENK